jgi:hypothetical protein
LGSDEERIVFKKGLRKHRRKEHQGRVALWKPEGSKHSKKEVVSVRDHRD